MRTATPMRRASVTWRANEPTPYAKVKPEADASTPSFATQVPITVSGLWTLVAKLTPGVSRYHVSKLAAPVKGA